MCPKYVQPRTHASMTLNLCEPVHLQRTTSFGFLLESQRCKAKAKAPAPHRAE